MTGTAEDGSWPSDAEIAAIDVQFIKPFEGFRALAYKCPAGVWTIGYGTTRYPDGKAVCEGEGPISEEKATEYLENDIAVFWKNMKPLLRHAPNLNQAAAMVSLTYNIGVGNFKSSTVLRDFNRGKSAAAANAFLMWDKAFVNRVLTVLPGLKRRREAERNLFQKT